MHRNIITTTSLTLVDLRGFAGAVSRFDIDQARQLANHLSPVNQRIFALNNMLADLHPDHVSHYIIDPVEFMEFKTWNKSNYADPLITLNHVSGKLFSLSGKVWPVAELTLAINLIQKYLGSIDGRTQTDRNNIDVGNYLLEHLDKVAGFAD